MKKLLTLLFIFFCLPSWGQKDSTQINKKAVSFSVFAGPAINYRKSYSDVSGIGVIRPQSVDVLSYYSNQERSGLGYQIGISFGLNLSSKISLSAGLAFQKMGYKTNLIDTVYGVYYDGSEEGKNYKIWHNMKINYNYYYLSLPINTSLNIAKNKYLITPTIGLSIDYLVKYERPYSFINQNSNNNFWLPTDGLNDQSEKLTKNPFYISFLASLGLGYVMKNHSIIIFEPQFKFMLNQFGSKDDYSNIKTPNNYLNTGERPQPVNLYSLNLNLMYKF